MLLSKPMSYHHIYNFIETGDFAKTERKVMEQMLQRTEVMSNNTKFCKYDIGKALSAKAKSVLALSSISTDPYMSPPVPLIWPTLHNTEKVKTYLHENRFCKIFARPCPLSPLHGFIDSRQISSFEDLTALALEIQEKAAPDEILEIMLMPYVEAQYSGVFTPNSITIGKGNDGATGGKEAIVIKTPYNATSFINSSVRAKFTKTGEAPFVEIVKSTSLGTVVQVRSGNQAGVSNDYIPKTTVVERVHEVIEDLVEWQKLAKTFKAGDVIYANSLACHGAVHGVANGIPVITSHVPKVGETLVAGSNPPLNLKKVKSLLAKLLNSREDFEYKRVLYGWRLLHSIAPNLQAGGEEQVAYVLYYMLMGGVSACLGEFRYYKTMNRRQGKKMPKLFDEVINPDNGGRDLIFHKAFEEKKTAFQLLFSAWRAFLKKGAWGDGSSVGGKKWADCTEKTVELGQSIARFFFNSTDASLKNCVTKANDLAHCVHNNALLFTKFGNCETEDVRQILNESEVLRVLFALKEQRIIETLDITLLKMLGRKIPKTISHREHYSKIAYEKKLAKAMKIQERKLANFCKKMVGKKFNLTPSIFSEHVIVSNSELLYHKTLKDTTLLSLLHSGVGSVKVISVGELKGIYIPVEVQACHKTFVVQFMQK